MNRIGHPIATSPESDGAVADVLRYCVHPLSACGQSAPLARPEDDLRNEERMRIARELHDSTAQSLVALQLHVLGLKELTSDPTYRSKIVEVEQTIEQLHQEIRDISTTCSAPAIPPDALVPSLRSMCERLSNLSGLAISFVARNPVEVATSMISQSLYRIAQELVANVVRHAKANRVAVELRASGTDLILVVADDGIGMTGQGCAGSGGTGLDNVRTRARELDGRMAYSRRRNGSRFTVTIPRAALSR